MKNFHRLITLAVLFPLLGNMHPPVSYLTGKLPAAKNLFIITLDGLRWQEVFGGADSTLLLDPLYSMDTSTLRLLYWDTDVEQRRRKLMPFTWSVIGKRGQLYGNRNLGNRSDVLNGYDLSYPGYNEIFTGRPDERIFSNRRIANPNINVLEYLNAQPGFHGKVAAFTSWELFPFILNQGRNKLPLNSGYQPAVPVSETQQLINAVQQEVVEEKEPTRLDQLTFLTAREYLRKERPRVLFLGLGETDEYAHKGQYDQYLQQITRCDQMIGELWQWVQSTPGYRDNTLFLITTDHGRGKKASRWTDHGTWVKGSSQTWFAVLGPGVAPVGEIAADQQHYQAQMARTISGILGTDFQPESAAPPLSLHLVAQANEY